MAKAFKFLNTYALIILPSLLILLQRPGLAKTFCEELKVPPQYQDILNYNSPKNIPRSCLDFASKSWLSDKSGPLPFLAKCSHLLATPIRGALAPCQTDEYLDYTHKSLLVAADCFNIDAKQMIPKIKGESGFLHNALGREGDAGIGQLTGPAIQDIRNYLPLVEAYLIENQTKSSCEIIWAHWKTIKTNLSATLSQRCQLLQWPENPFRNIVLTAVFVKYLEKLTSSEFELNQIPDLLSALGLEKKYYSSLKQVLANLSYNSGSKQAVGILRSYLLARRASSRPFVNPEDFNFKADLSWMNKADRWNQIPISDLTFPAYLRMKMKVGNPGYLGDLMGQIYNYNSNMPRHHICTPEFIEGYLAI